MHNGLLKFAVSTTVTFRRLRFRSVGTYVYDIKKNKVNNTSTYFVNKLSLQDKQGNPSLIAQSVV